MTFSEFQHQVTLWMRECFGRDIAEDKQERTDRFLEEAVELAQATGHTKERVLELVEYVYNRPVGELQQEVGGVLVTLSALTSAHKMHLVGAARSELWRCNRNIDKIRAKQRLKREAGVARGTLEVDSRQP